MEHIQVGAYHSIAESDAEQGEIKDCSIMLAEHKKTQKKEPAHKHTAGEDAIIRSIPVLFQEKFVLIPDQDMFVGAAPGMPEISDLEYHREGIMFAIWQGDSPGHPKRSGFVFRGGRFSILYLHYAINI